MQRCRPGRYVHLPAESTSSGHTGCPRTVAGQLSFLPVVDGPGGIIPDRISVLIESGNLSRIPCIIGANLDEGGDYFPLSLDGAD